MRSEKPNTRETGNGRENQIEDLTLTETESTDVKGGSGRYLLELRDVKGDVSDSNS